MKKNLLLILCCTCISMSYAQEANPRPLTLEEYQKSKTYTIRDLDKETYVKFDGAYILDRYELKKPYFITGDDGLKKRIDLYTFIAKENLQELGLMIFYTNEKGKQYQVCLPNFTADASVWKKYFEDIHAIDKEEKDFVLKLSYVLSKEMGFQRYKSINQGKDLSKESATYGNDICFPGSQEVVMENGHKKKLAEIKAGDKIITLDPLSRKQEVIEVKELVSHEAKNYALVQLVLIASDEKELETSREVRLYAKTIEATPNHPMTTVNGDKKMSELTEGEEVLCFNEILNKYAAFVVVKKEERARGMQQVYNIVSDEGTTLLLNGVMVRQK